MFIFHKSKDHKNTIDSLEEVFDDPSFRHLRNDIYELIQYSPGEYVIFIDSEHDLDWETTRKFDSQSALMGQESSISDSICRINRINHQPGVRYFTKDQKREFIWLLGTSLIATFEYQKEEAGNALEEAKIYLLQRKYEITRSWQLSFALAIFCAIYVLLQNDFVNIKGENFACISASIGVLLSIIHRTGHMEYDCKSGRWLNFLEVFAKYVVGVISALLVMALFREGMIFPNWSGGVEVDDLKFIICLVAGFCERIVPSIVEHFTMKGIG